MPTTVFNQERLTELEDALLEAHGRGVPPVAEWPAAIALRGSPGAAPAASGGTLLEVCVRAASPLVVGAPCNPMAQLVARGPGWLPLGQTEWLQDNASARRSTGWRKRVKKSAWKRPPGLRAWPHTRSEGQGQCGHSGKGQGQC